MYIDPIVEEIRHYREEHAQKHGNNIHEIAEALRDSQKKSNRRIANRKPKLFHKSVA